MTRRRLRPAYSPDDLARMYAHPHDHTRWPDHRLRVAVTIAACQWVVGRADIQRAADLSCGDAAILRALDVPETILGDYAPGYAYTGPIEETIEQIDPVDLFVCSETLEHLDDPDTVLRKIRQKTTYLVLSTPVDALHDVNPEHYWAWTRQGVEDMLADAQFRVEAYTPADPRPADFYYLFGIWVCH